MNKLLVVLSFLTAHAYGQGCAGFTKQYNITIQPGKISGRLTGYTMLVAGTYAGAPDLRVGGVDGVTSTNGYDIIFPGTTWNMPIYNSATGQIKANVLVPSAAEGTVVAMCVGKSSVTTFQGGANAYDAATNTVLQFANGKLGVDSTGQNVALTNNGGVPHIATGPGALVDAITFNGSTSMSGGAQNFQTGVAPLTTSLWVKTSSLADMTYLAYGINQGCTDNAWAVRSYAPSLNDRMRVFRGCGDFSVVSSGVIVPGVWQKWDFAFNTATSNVDTYLNGVAAGGGGFSWAMPTTLGSFVLGRMLLTGAYPGQTPYIGDMAEVRMSNVTRSGAWIAAEYQNQTNPSAFYAITPVVQLVISAVSIVPNSPLSVLATWTTDAPANSQALCVTAPGGPYPYASSIVDPNPVWSVTAHSMASNPMPNAGAKYCIVMSTSASGGAGSSAEVGPIALPAMPFSTPMALIGKGNINRLGDRLNGVNGAPKTGAWEFGDFVYFAWADDNNEYHSTTQWGLPDGTLPLWLGQHPNPLGLAYVKITDARHTIGTRIGTDWQNGVTNLGFGDSYFITSTISVNKSLYSYAVPAGSGGGNIYRSANRALSNISPQSNVGPDTTYISGMTCSAGTVTATTKLALNMSAQIAAVAAPGVTAIFVEGATGTNVNGLHAVTANTSTTISWAQACAGWSWDASGGTGSGGGTVSTYGWDTPTGTNTPGMRWNISWVQTDANDYQLGSKQAGMDSFVYFWAAIPTRFNHFLCRMRVEDMPLQDIGKAGCYIGQQNGDDGLYDSNWDYSTNKVYTARFLNRPAFDAEFYGKGASQLTSQYVTAFHRYVYSQEIAGNADGDSGGTMIYEGGPYPWSQVTLIGDNRRNPDLYASGSPEFPEFVAKSQENANGVTSMNLANSGNNFGADVGGYDMYMTPDYKFAARNNTAVAANGTSGEVTKGMDLAYSFEGTSGSMSMPNEAPGDAPQRWAWKADVDPMYGVKLPMYIDKYGSTWFTQFVTATPSEGGLPTKDIRVWPISTPYAEALPGPLTVIDCLGHYPTSLLKQPGAKAIALHKGTDLAITWAGAKTGALASAVLSGGSIVAFTILRPGNVGGYATPPIVAIRQGGNGVPATAVAVLGTGATAGQIVSFTITNPGTLIDWAVVTIDQVSVSGGGLTSISVGDGGNGYTTAPTVTITGGTGAVATANLMNGVVTSITVSTHGTGFTWGPNVNVVISEPTNNWNVSILATPVGSVSIPDNSIGCVVVRRDSSNRVSLYNSAGVGKSLPLTASGPAVVVAGAWTTSPLEIGEYNNSFWGIESLLRVWSRDLGDDELISEMAAIRDKLWARGKASSIP